MRIDDLESQVLTAPEVARILRCSAGHVHELVKRGELPAMQHVGRKVLITRRAIEAFIEAASGELVSPTSSALPHH